jgi:hypothetical protein
MKLYEIDNAILTMLALSDETGELPEGFAAELDALDMDRKQKLDNICRVIRHHEIRAAVIQSKFAAIQAELDRVKASKDSEDRTVKSLKDYCKLSMQAMGEAKVETDLFKLTICGNGGNPPVKIDCEPEQLPKEFQRVTVAADVSRLLAVWKEGRALPEGVEVGERGTHLRIK